MPKKILFLMSDTGGGHRSAAEAIAEALAQGCGEMAQSPSKSAEAQLVDFLATCLPFPFNRSARIYRPWVTYAPWLYNLIWYGTDTPKLTDMAMRLMSIVAKERMLTSSVPIRLTWSPAPIPTPITWRWPPEPPSADVSPS
jgi:hypothetical protein